MRQEWDIPLLGLGSSVHGVELNGNYLSAGDGTDRRWCMGKIGETLVVLVHLYRGEILL